MEEGSLNDRVVRQQPFPMTQAHQTYEHPGYDQPPPPPYNMNILPGNSPASQNTTNTVVVNQTVVLVPPEVPNLYGAYRLACFTFWFCNPLFGAIAFFIAMSASNARDDGLFEDAKKRRMISYWVSGAGAIVGSITVVVFLGMCLGSTACVADTYDPYYNY